MLNSPKHCQIQCFLLIFFFNYVNSLCIPNYDACSICLNSTHCAACYSYHGLNSSGFCVRCTDINCVGCQGDTPSLCEECADYYHLNGSSSCVKSENCAETECIHCPNSTTVCEQCDHTTPFNGLYNETCINCTIPNCYWCKIDATICQSCVHGFGPIMINNTLHCSVCSDYQPNCIDCSGDIRSCVYCDNHYGVNLTSLTRQCVLCSTSNCQICGRDSNICTECRTNYGLNQTGCYLCIQSPSFCLTCDPLVLIKCNSCPPQRYMENKICKCYPSDCFLCSSRTTCDQCATGYFRTINGLCATCPRNCAQCFFNANYSRPECTSCTNSSFLLDQSLPPVCHQTCGDNYNTEYPCESPISRLYDGCSDTCQIEDNFTCTLLSTNNLTDLCKYSGTIQLQYIGYTKQQFSNSITLKFSIFPPLYAFTITPQEDLIKMFELSNNNFSVKAILINQETFQMIFLCDLIGDVFSNQIVYVYFNPSQASTSNYFLTNATILQEFQFPYTIYYYQQIVFTFSKLLVYICFVVSALGWISAILGFVFRKLAGLQAMMVIQFSWITILCLNGPLLLPFRQLYPLIYSNGYNHHFSEPDSQISRQSPYTSYFNLSKTHFYDNWNINLLFILLAFIFVVATTIRAKRFISCHSSEIKQNEQLSDELENLMEQNGKTYEWLMYLCMLNLTYFVCVSLLFFKLGNITNILSLILFSIAALILLFTFARFTIGPYPFGYFRFSFQAKCLAMEHYCFIILMTTSSVALVFLFSSHAFISLVPSLVLLVYTLIYRPYKYLKNNLRSAFNLLAICSFISFRVYAEYTPSNLLNTMPAYAFLLVNVCFFLPCCAILGIAYTIYGHCEERFIMEEEQAYRNTEKGKKQWMRRNILKQLVSIENYSKKIGDVQLKTVFKQLIDPNTSLVEASSLLKNEKRNQISERPFIGEEAEEITNNKYKQYKKLIKRDQIDLIKSIKEKRGEDLDKIVFQKFDYDDDNQKFTEQKGEKRTGRQQKVDSGVKDEKAQQKKKLNIQLTEDILLTQNKFIEFKAIEDDVMKQKQKIGEASFNILMREYQNIQNINIM